jgi:hypothetical protein
MNTILKTTVISLFAVLVFSDPGFAQPPGDAAFKKVKLLKKRLDLTDKQADSIYTILKKYDYSQCDDVTSFTKKGECFKNVHSTKEEKMKSVLTETQKTELDDFIVECQENHGPKKDTVKKQSNEKVSCTS